MMKGLFSCTIGMLCGLPMLAQPPAGYYDAAQGLTGTALRQALHDIIDDHDPASYQALWGHFQSTDARTDGKVWDIYTDIPGGTPQYLFSFGTDQCGQYGAEGECYNREHSFPSSWFGNSAPMNSDLFHIYPTDGYVNNRRDNYPFGEVNGHTYISSNGSKLGSNVSGGYSGVVFEPIDAYKGDLARSYFYMYTRYLGQTSGWSSPMQQGSDLAPWARNLLLDWHVNDPVSPKEQARNNAIFGIQHNRNPYIDDPQWVHDIWGSGVGLEEQWSVDVRIWSDGRTLYIVAERPLEGTLHILDPAGRVVLTRSLREPRTELETALPDGLYIAELVTEQGRLVQRFVRSAR